MGMRMDGSNFCYAVSAIEWILTPGLIEETFKVVWLALRLHRTPSELPRTCCFGTLQAGHTNQCGCWHKLAQTPYHVFVCAIACGAGFECVENVDYVFKKNLGNPLAIALVRMPTSAMHM